MSASHQTGSQGAAPEDICLTCGLCCNGVIFADVRLQAGDDPELLHGLGLPLKVSRRSGPTPYGQHGSAAVPVRQCKFSQPCAAWDGCRCRVYPSRPKHCQDFECGVLKQLKRGAIKRAAALRLIGAAREQAERVVRLLHELGDTDEHLPLRTRFRRTARRLEDIGIERPLAETFGKLTLAVHDLNFLLSDAFYPGDSSP